MNDEQKAKAVQMVKQGKTIVSISRELGLEWAEVSECVHSEGALSFQGAKSRITNRLNKLRTEKDTTKREQLVDEVSNLFNYIYFSGKDMGKAIDRARIALGSQGAKLAK